MQKKSPDIGCVSLPVLDKNLHDATIVISTPFHPAYMTRERIAASPKLKLLLTAGIGSDHVDLKAAAERGMTVAEVTGVLLGTGVNRVPETINPT